MEVNYNVTRSVEGTATDSYVLDLTEEEYKDFLEKKEDLENEGEETVETDLLGYLLFKYPNRGVCIDTEYDDQGGETLSVEFV